MDLRLRYRFIPVVSIVVFLVLFVVFSWSLGFLQGGQGRMQGVESDASRSIPLSARLQWGVAAILLASAMTGSIMYSIYVIRQYAEDRREIVSFLLLSTATLALPAVLVVLTWTSAGSGLKEIYRGMRSGLGFSMLNYAVPINVLAFVTIVCTTVAAMLLIRMPRDPSPGSIFEVANKVNDTNTLMSISSLILLASMFEIYSEYRLGIAAAGKAGDPALREFASSVTLYVGLLYTGLMIVIFGSVMIVQRMFVHQQALLKSKSDKDFDRERWMNNLGISTSPLSAAARILSLIAPAVAGSIVNMFFRGV
jgi:hypothetical protein